MENKTIVPAHKLRAGHVVLIKGVEKEIAFVGNKFVYFEDNFVRTDFLNLIEKFKIPFNEESTFQCVNFYEIGQVLTLDFFKSENGNTIAKTSEGVVCIVDNLSSKILLKSETWKVQISEIHEKVLIVYPIERIWTAKQNNEIAITNLKKQFAKPAVAKTKVKKAHLYKSKQEILA